MSFFRLCAHAAQPKGDKRSYCGTCKNIADSGAATAMLQAYSALPGACSGKLQQWETEAMHELKNSSFGYDISAMLGLLCPDIALVLHRGIV